MFRFTGIIAQERLHKLALQEVYGKLLHESWLSKSKEVILEGTEKFSAQTGEKNSVEFLCFQSEIHESYSTFMETLVEQFAAASYGDLIYGRQVVIYLHRCVESSIRLAAWNALSNARVLELLPPLGNSFAKGEGYLEPVEVILQSFFCWYTKKSIHRNWHIFILICFRLHCHVYLIFLHTKLPHSVRFMNVCNYFGTSELTTNLLNRLFFMNYLER